MTIVRIAHAEPRPGDLGNGQFLTHGFLVVLADEGGRRALPFWLGGEPGADSLGQLAGHTGWEILTADAPEELAVRLLDAAGAAVTGVDLDLPAASLAELRPEACTARIELGGPGTGPVTARIELGGPGTGPVTARIELGGPGTGPVTARFGLVTARFGLGLAVAAAADAPIRVADETMDRLAVPVPGDDLIGPFLDLVPPAAQLTGGRVAGDPVRLAARRPRYEPRNMGFADGLDRWDLDGGFVRDASDAHRGDYTAVAEGESAVLSAAAERPAGSAALVQTIFANDYRGATVVFSGEIRTAPLTYEAGLRVEILRQLWRVRGTRSDHGVTVAGGRSWTRHEVTAAIPEDADMIRFGLTLAGPGQVALRHAELTRGA